MNRRNNRVREDGDGGGNGGGVGGNVGISIDDHERFILNQYYNAVEDEQIYIDEYTSLTHRYNDFIVNTNTMFVRMEQTLRESITRSIVRQSYYHQQSDEIRERMRRRGGVNGRSQPLAAPASAPPVPPAEEAAASAAAVGTNRFGDVLPRLISRYITADRARVYRGSNNIFSMLYSIPAVAGAGAGAEAGVGAGIGAGAAGAAIQNNENAPTNHQIQRATLNTVFSNIISPMNATCPISRDEFNDTSEITMMRGCNHIFNRDSLREWFTRHSTCPMCRQDIRQYRPDRSLHPDTMPVRTPAIVPAPAPAVANRNLTIDHADDEHITFSFDIPLETNNNNNDAIYNDIINTVRQMVRNTTGTDADADADADADDIMEVD